MVGPFESVGERNFYADLAMKPDPNTGRPLGDHGTAEQAIEFALHHSKACSMEIETFLRQWEQGHLDEWPEYYTWLAEGAEVEESINQTMNMGEATSWAGTPLNSKHLRAHDLYVELYAPTTVSEPGYYVYSNGAAVFVKDAEIFTKQDGLKSDWGKHWIPIHALTPGTARRIGHQIFGIVPSHIHSGET